MTDFAYHHYRCVSGNPLHCDPLLQESGQDAKSKSCGQCGFPAVLATEVKIRGKCGIYEIAAWKGCRGLGRLYSALELPDDRPVVIREYLLPPHTFNVQATRDRKLAFSRLAALELADGRSQDFRLIVPWDVIADQREERCYLVTKGDIELHPTLQTELAQRGAMTGSQVRRVLAQVLQTLEFLNSHKFRLPNGQILEELTHGNLRLETLLFADNLSDKPATEQSLEILNDTPEPSPAKPPTWGDDFLIYVCDPALWEFLFAPPTTLLPEPNVTEDLAELGRIAFFLLAGRTTDPKSGLPLDPKTNQSFPPVSVPFKHYIQRLIGMGMPFPNFTVARQTLLQLPPEPLNLDVVLSLRLDRNEKPPKPPFPWRAVLLLSLLVLLAGLLLRWWSSRRPQPSIATEKLLCCVNKVSNIPTGKFTYTANDPGLWSYVLRQENLIERGKTLEQILQALQPRLVLNYQPEPTTEAALQRVRSQQAEFLITSLADQVTADLEPKTVAFDGLSVFIAFSYARRANSLPRFLRGQITFDQLRRLYIGEVQNWNQLGGPDLPVKLYIPPETEAVRIFEQRVLRDDQSIARFRAMQRGSMTTQPTFSTLRQVIRDFEQDNVGSIAFGSLSQVFGQCSIYPLALVNGSQPPVQALIQDNGMAITPETNLCAAKGSYDRDVVQFQTGRYPLSYPLAVVYPRDNRRPPLGQKFAEMLQTEESQRLLTRTGLVPLQPLPKEQIR